MHFFTSNASLGFWFASIFLLISFSRFLAVKSAALGSSSVQIVGDSYNINNDVIASNQHLNSANYDSEFTYKTLVNRVKRQTKFDWQKDDDAGELKNEKEKLKEHGNGSMDNDGKDKKNNNESGTVEIPAVVASVTLSGGDYFYNLENLTIASNPIPITNEDEKNTNHTAMDKELKDLLEKHTQQHKELEKPIESDVKSILWFGGNDTSNSDGSSDKVPSNGDTINKSVNSNEKVNEKKSTDTKNIALQSSEDNKSSVKPTEIKSENLLNVNDFARLMAVDSEEIVTDNKDEMKVENNHKDKVEVGVSSTDISHARRMSVDGEEIVTEKVNKAELKVENNHKQKVEAEVGSIGMSHARRMAVDAEEIITEKSSKVVLKDEKNDKENPKVADSSTGESHTGHSHNHHEMLQKVKVVTETSMVSKELVPTSSESYHKEHKAYDKHTSHHTPQGPETKQDLEAIIVNATSSATVESLHELDKKHSAEKGEMHLSEYVKPTTMKSDSKHKEDKKHKHEHKKHDKSDEHDKDCHHDFDSDEDDDSDESDEDEGFFRKYFSFKSKSTSKKDPKNEGRSLDTKSEDNAEKKPEKLETLMDPTHNIDGRSLKS